MPSVRSMVTLAALAASVCAQSSGRRGHGVIGHGIPMYEPECAHACRGGSPRAGIDCGNGEEHAAGHHGGVAVTPECMAVNEPWLKTVAYCISQRCAKVDNSTLEFYWQTELISRHDEPRAKWSYQESLSHALNDGIPTEELEEGGVLNRTVLVNEDSYLATANGNTGFRNSEIWHVNLNIIILLTGAGIPILCSLLRFVPFPEPIISKFNAYVIEPPVIGSHHNVPILKNMAIVPTRGQALFLLYLFALNIVASFAGLDLRQPNSWWHDSREEFLAIYSNRVGMLAFGNLPVLILYAGRNNVLLWVTDWSHSTFLLLHRWIAFICVLEAAIHSAVYLDIHLTIYKDHATIAAVEYWYWGIIATVALVIMIPMSILPLRQRMYEVFHAAHIVLAIITLAGCWYHIIWRYERQWGYEVWVIVAMCVWGFDWIIRGIRVARNGVKTAHVTSISDDYLRVDIPNLDAHGHVYLYFPTLNWRLWESHPFSVIGHSSFAGASTSTVRQEAPEQQETGAGQSKEVASPSSTSVSSGDSAKLGPRCTTLFIRLQTGTTMPLAAKAGLSTGVPVLIESSYGHQSAVSSHGGLPTPSSTYPNLVVIAGGVGITAALPILDNARSLYASQGSKKLFWGVRSGSEALVSSVQGLVRASGTAVQEIFTPLPGMNTTQWADVDVSVSVGERLDIRGLLEAELSKDVGTLVFVCGPAGLADDVRNTVTALGRHGALVQYAEEAFAW